LGINQCEGNYNPVFFQYHFKKDAVKSLMEKYKL